MSLIRSIIPGIVLMAVTAMFNAAHAQAEGAAVLVNFGNGEVITEKDLNEYLARRVDLKAASGNASGVMTVVQEMALTRALALEGAGMGIEQRTERGRFDDAYALTIFKTISPACEAPKDSAAARDFYDKTPQAFTVPTTIRLSRVILPVEAVLDGEPAEAWLLAQAKAMSQGQRKFEESASQAEKIYKLDPQGDVGWVALNADNVILRALEAANQGDMVGPVKDGDYVYLFQVVVKRPSQLMPWNDVSAGAAQRAVNYCREQGSAEVRQRMFKKYNVQINENAVRGIFKTK